jgi:tetratricopeptide (TPR) repeat protein
LTLSLFAISCSRDPKSLSRKYLQSGDQLVAKKNLAEALIQYRNAVAQDGGNGEARVKLGGVYEATGDLRNALREYVRAADLMPDDIDSQLHAGKLLIAAGQFPEAKARAMSVLAKDSKNSNALVLLGNSLAGMKDIDGAIAQIEEAIDVEPRTTLTYANLGLFELRKGDRRAAEQAFKRAVEVDSKSVSARLNLANFYWAAGQRPDAERELKNALAIDSKSADVNRMLAVFCIYDGRRPEAEPYLRAFAEASENTQPKIALADFYLADGKTGPALQVLEALSKDKEGFGPAKLRMAAIAFQGGQHAQAHQTLDEVLKRYPRNEQTLEARARFQLAERKYDDAIKVTSSVIDANPQAATSYYLRGMALARTGSTLDAIKNMQKVLELVPSAGAAQLQLASLHLANLDPKAAIDLLNPLIKAQPRSAALRMLMGEAQLKIGNLRGAEAELAPLERAFPTSGELQLLLGQVYAAKPDFGRARQAFAKAFELQPNSVAALNGLVTLDVVEKKPQAATARLEPFLASHPNDEALLFLAANIHLTIGNIPRAESLFQKVLQINPASLDAYARLGRLYWSQNRLDQARAQYEEAARHQARPVATKTLLALILELQNRPDEARKLYEEVLAIEPRSAVAANNLAMYHSTRGDLEVALQLAQTAKAALPDDARVSDTLGWIYYKKGLTSLAVSAFQQSVHQNATNPTVHYHLGLAYLKDGNPKEGRKALEQALKLNPQFQDAEQARQALKTIKG